MTKRGAIIGMAVWILILSFMVTRPATEPSPEMPPAAQDSNYLWIEQTSIGGEPVQQQPVECTQQANCL